MSGVLALKFGIRQPFSRNFNVPTVRVTSLKSQSYAGFDIQYRTAQTEGA
ncbi:hypothetical protein [Bradyrhizobium nanningense]|nr:hypothetical protein [Bradyrhizobium nanningense]